MTGLLPLALPNSRSNTPSPVPDEGADDNMEGCFPEMLARDLEMSSAIFAAKNMTAGEARQQSTLPRSNSHIPISSMVSFIEQRGYVSEETGSDVESLPASESSGGMEIPSIRLREQSIVTAATSLTSASGSAPSPKDLLSLDRAHEYSWIDIDSDDDDDEDEIEVQEEPTIEDQSATLSPRPPTPPSTETTFDITVMMKDIDQPPRQQPHQTSPSGDSTQSWHQRQISIKSMGAPKIPPRRASLSQATNPLDATYRPKTPCFESRVSTESPRQQQSPYYTQRFRDETDNNTILLKSDFGSIELEIEEDSYMDDYTPDYPPVLSRPDTIYIQETPPPSPLPTVQSWLDGSNPPCLPQIPVDDLAKAVPLPPDIIETLRVSLACFPETMLLSSSLTIETIRTYSKKVRHPSTDIWNESPVDPAAPGPRRSIWKKVVSHGRESIGTRRHRLHMYEDGAHQDAVASPAPWASLRHVFGGCSDYICDALYAHIVAYNYVSRVPRNQPASQQRASTSYSKHQSEDIPKKAATLLGLSAPQTHLTPNVGRFAKKFSTPLTAMGFGKDEVPSTTAQDNATRNIESGLLRCISRLVATAKMMTEEGSGEDKLVDVEPQEVDMIFVRSLCEIVRISEEAT
ncbi:uncharacterized protein NECHADRAFT_93849 [Fusarium vanettenii 77-13-4]|uniref:Uncharacterized protein n=1 Tax=Fusarium vanettenii (strain ATCC MYA-4622 / CBS 123669 / FGSC 9596 / NRRL 45880 / 77-13-4) TaxID=660122 RepID=C7YSI9_FUSV7|nr:uncharacterized protein NECHADRAFT_93849 [Fusarium vanettenii 77-13-4]EEU45648.1 hypothetical protein NECHADRAFT_93849 [Fusarium vanettenii 77-13-4]